MVEHPVVLDVPRLDGPQLDSVLARGGSNRVIEDIVGCWIT
jgi:hypothetical protein